MADPRFHKVSGPFTIKELAAIAGAEPDEGADPEKLVKDVAALDQAGPDNLSFLDNVRYRDQFENSRAGVCIVAPEMNKLAPAGMALLYSANPYKSYALVASAFYPEQRPAPSVAKHAFIGEGVMLGEGCIVEYGAVIGEGARIGRGTWIEANAVIGARVEIGENCRIGAGSTISHSLIGNKVRIYPGCRIGQDGFGFAIDPAGHVKVPQLGRVIIEDSVEIGANTTIDRGSGPDTVIGQGTWIDNLVQIGHNVKLGRGCVIVAQVGISGSTVIDDYAVLAGQAGIAGHLHVGKGAKIGAQSGVMRDVPPGAEMLGSPALPIRQTMKNLAMLSRLTKDKLKS